MSGWGVVDTKHIRASLHLLHVVRHVACPVSIWRTEARNVICGDARFGNECEHGMLMSNWF